MATVSGKDGDLSLDAEIEKVLSWNISYKIEQHGAAHSDSEGWKEHTGGIKEWSGSAILQADSGKVPTSVNTAMLADTAMAFVGTAYTGSEYSGNVKITSIDDIGADVTTGAVENITINFVGHGALTPAVTS